MCPSSRLVREGQVSVAESETGGRDQAWLANGFLLGQLRGAIEPDENTRMEMLGVVPEVDFESGLYQVLIHTDLDEDPGLGQGEEDRKRGTWIPTQRSRMVDAAPWREGSKLMTGFLDGVQKNAALASGVRLVGRVTRTGPFTSDVAGPGDLGFHVPVIAVWQDVGRPERTHVLGRLVSLGRNEQGQVLMEWQANLPLQGGEPERAHLYTGSGDPGVPRGLLIGETIVPTGPGPHVLVVEPPAESRVLQGLALFQFEGPSKFVRRSR